MGGWVCVCVCVCVCVEVGGVEGCGWWLGWHVSNVWFACKRDRNRLSCLLMRDILFCGPLLSYTLVFCGSCACSSCQSTWLTDFLCHDVCFVSSEWFSCLSNTLEILLRLAILASQDGLTLAQLFVWQLCARGLRSQVQGLGMRL